MTILSIILAALASYALGAVWYMSLAKPWMAASGVPVGDDGKPVNSSSPVPYLISLVAMLIVATMMRYGFGVAGVEGVVGGLLGGIAIGAFFITPWIALNNDYSTRPMSLTVIDGGYAILGCGVMGLVLTLF